MLFLEPPNRTLHDQRLLLLLQIPKQSIFFAPLFFGLFFSFLVMSDVISIPEHVESYVDPSRKLGSLSIYDHHGHTTLRRSLTHSLTHSLTLENYDKRTNEDNEKILCSHKKQ